MANTKKTRPVEYTDPDGQTQTGYYADGHVYQDEAGTQPIAVGSTFRTDGGDTYRMTPYGGVLWAAARDPEQTELWLPQANPWYRQAEDLTQALANRPAFAYDPARDPFYQGARDQYQTQAARAMEDTVARLSGLTGGYGSTYAQSAGAQQYDRAMSGLWELLPELYDRAASRDAQQRQAQERELAQLLGLYDRDYQVFLDRLERKDDRADAAQAQSNWDREQENWALEFTQQAQLQQQKLDQAAAAADATQAQRERAYAYRMAMAALSQGLPVTAALLEQAGIDPDYAERLRQWYAAKLAR